MPVDYLPVLLQVIVAIAFAGGSLALSIVLGQSGKRTVAKDKPYECGKDPIGASTSKFSVKFYLVAMLFILFDIETIFFVVWAIVYQQELQQGLTVLYAMLFFTALLAVGFAYELKKKALDWVH